MTLTLAANIDDEQRFIAITGTVPDSIEPGYEFRIGDERLTLQGFVMPANRMHIDVNQWYVIRGLNDTAASHTAGDVILGAADAFVSAETGTAPPNPFEGGSVGGAVQQVSLLGPYTFHYNDVGIDDDGVEVADLPIGAVVMSTWLVATVEWLADGEGAGHSAYTSLALDGGGTPVAYPIWGSVGSLYGEGAFTVAADRQIHYIIHTDAGHHTLCVQVYPGSGMFSQGEGEAWVLVATPA